jgi:hypothetical protein
MGDEVTFGVGQSDPESVKLLLRFSLMIPLEAAKNARTWEMKCRLVSDSLTQSVRSAERSISSVVQKEASF